MKKIPYYLIYTILFILCFVPGLLIALFAISKRISDNIVEQLDDLYYWSTGVDKRKL